MPLVYTIPQYIQFGEATTFLMANYQAEGVLWGGRLVQPSSPVLVAIVTDSLKWEYDRLLAAAELELPETIGINNVDSLLINSTDKFII